MIGRVGLKPTTKGLVARVGFEPTVDFRHSIMSRGPATDTASELDFPT